MTALIEYLDNSMINEDVGELINMDVEKVGEIPTGGGR